MNPDYLYAFPSDEYLKIGLTSQPRRRWNAVRCRVPFRLRAPIFWEIPPKRFESKTLENKVMVKLRTHHLRGEWFTINALPGLLGMMSTVKQANLHSPVDLWMAGPA